MLKNKRDVAFTPEEDGKRGPIKFIEDLQRQVATWWPMWATWWAPVPAASRATNSVSVVHRRGHSVCAQQAFRRRVLGRQDRPDLLTTPWKTPARCRSKSTCRQMNMGDVIELAPYEGKAFEERHRRSPSFTAQERCAVRRGACRWPHST
jgi:aconitate hydratase 2/2-methylisocitrate dehydratase